ncbi:MAG TPA: HD domain-containing phosphohydrolase [Candidatus Solibacter sp.]|jgi:putative nucleotidyltransferase with HDIG domain|nr:HD domain-containing phosphohydrolase [Candidatus Solibacter sp.]
MTTERILVVDDEEPIREIISSMLNAAGFKTRQASSGMEALTILHTTGEFELMLSDLMMAELDGIALLERSKERFPDMPVIMVTAVHDISVALAAIRNGAYDYLLKPFEREQLLAMVRRALETRRLKLENRAYQSNLESLVAARTEQLRQAMNDLVRSYDITLEALGDALDLKDSETEGHSKRVTAFTIAIARAMGLSAERVHVIARGAFLHDIGKMAIPDVILRKPGSLTPEETATMREHCFRGYQMLRKIPFLSEAAEIVYAHQERFDGTGYPRGLKGDEIPLGARIFSVADTLDAMTSDRPYRAAQPVAAAREEIKRFSARQFDPEVVKVFLQMPESIWEELRKEINAQAYRSTYPVKSAQNYTPTANRTAINTASTNR